MATIKWCENASPDSCITDGQWDAMVDFIQHSKCTDFIIYGDCTCGTCAVEKFKFGGNNNIEFDGDRAIKIDDDETYLGHGAGDSITTGTNNTLIGHDAGKSLTTGSKNVAIGTESCVLATIGNSNVSIGYNAGAALSEGDGNIFIGDSAGAALTTSDWNLGIGYEAGKAITTGTQNILIGRGAGKAITTSNENIFVGDRCGESCNGYRNTAIGGQSLLSITTGNDNTAFGRYAGRSATATLEGCVYLGFRAGETNTTANTLWINNSGSAYPLIWGDFANDKVNFGDNDDEWFFEFEFDANSSIIDSGGNNRDIYLRPDGTGLVRFGTYAAKGSETFQGYITMHDAAGNTRKVMICA